MSENGQIETADKIIDLGTGNGVMLRELDDYGFTDLTGIDYSAKSIELAKKVCAEVNGLSLQQQDIMELNQERRFLFLFNLLVRVSDPVSRKYIGDTNTFM